MGERRNGPDVGRERARRAEDLPRPPHEQLQPVVVGSPVAVLDPNPLHPERVPVISQKDPVGRVRFVLRDAQKILEPVHERLREEGAGDLSGGPADDAGVRGVDVLDDSGREPVPVTRLFIEVGETDLLVEDRFRVRSDGEEPGDHCVAVPHEVAPDVGFVRRLAEPGPEEDRRAAKRAGGEHEQRGLEGNGFAGFLIDAVGADYLHTAGPQA